MKWQAIRSWLFERNAAIFAIPIVWTVLFLVAHDRSPAWPISSSTILWTMAAVLPASAWLYSVFRLRSRLEEIEERTKRHQLHFVYFPNLPAQGSNAEFSRFLLGRFQLYHSPYELTLLSVGAAGVTFLIGSLLFRQVIVSGADPAALLTLKADDWVKPVAAAFFGAAAGSYALLLKKYARFDLYPLTYLQIAVAITVGSIAGSFLSTAWPTSYTPFLGFATAFLSATNVGYLPSLLRQLFAKASGTTLPVETPTDLGMVIHNADTIDSLDNIGLTSIAEFVNTDPLRLYLNLPQPMTVINGWLDHALVVHVLPADHQTLRELGRARFVDLMTTCLDGSDDFTWRTTIDLTGDPARDRRILDAVRTTVANGNYERLLGMLSPLYRSVFFGAGGDAEPPPVAIAEAAA